MPLESLIFASRISAISSQQDIPFRNATMKIIFTLLIFAATLLVVFSDFDSNDLEADELEDDLQDEFFDDFDEGDELDFEGFDDKDADRFLLVPCGRTRSCLKARRDRRNKCKKRCNGKNPQPRNQNQIAKRKEVCAEKCEKRARDQHVACVRACRTRRGIPRTRGAPTPWTVSDCILFRAPLFAFRSTCTSPSIVMCFLFLFSTIPSQRGQKQRTLL